MTVSPLNYKAYRLACNVILPISRRSGLYCIHLSATKDFPSQRRHASTRTISTAIVPTNDGLKLGSLPLTWQHTGWTEKMLLEVVPSHRKPRTFGDKFAWKLTRVCRWGMDFVTRMGPLQRVDSKNPTTAVVAQKPLTESQWLIRFIFLESIAGVPGMVAGTLRHLHSIRRFRPDHGWIKTLLEESYNERMHLLTFLEMYQPGRLMRFMVFAAQGIFYNTMFISYLISPKVCHRFVGYLEEEAVHTYTRCLKEIDDGSVPGWVDPGFKIPEVAVQYWNMREGRRTMRDLILYIRADEASHRGVNHTLGNLDQVSDPNPFLETDGGMAQPMNPKQVAVIKPGGLEREELFRSRS